jgi:RNA polymerase sigma-70 factor, ECF subfamily
MTSFDHLRLASAPEPDRAEPIEPDVPGAELLDVVVARARRRDPQAWARLYQDHFEALHRHLTYLVSNATVAEDLVQEVFARALVSIDRFDGRSSFIGWLRGIASNTARMYWRSQSRQRSAHQRMEHGVQPRGCAAPDEAHMQTKRAQALLAALETLPANLREAFVVLDLQERDADEAARELGLSVGNLRVRASRARARVREVLRHEGWITEHQKQGRND